MILLLDIDGTLADLSVRHTAAGQEPDKVDLVAYQAWLDRLQPREALLDDRAFPAMVWLSRALEDKCIVVYLTGRSEQYREVTREWLRRHGFPTGPVYMRTNEDYRSAKDYKHEQVLKIQAAYGMDIISFDDDPANDCSAMYRALGIFHNKAMGDAL